MSPCRGSCPHTAWWCWEPCHIRLSCRFRIGRCRLCQADLQPGCYILWRRCVRPSESRRLRSPQESRCPRWPYCRTRFSDLLLCGTPCSVQFSGLCRRLGWCLKRFASWIQQFRWLPVRGSHDRYPSRQYRWRLPSGSRHESPHSFQGHRLLMSIYRYI